MKLHHLLILVFFTANLSANERQQDTINLQNLVIINNEKDQEFFTAPYSANAFTQQDIEQQGIESTQNIAAKIPNFNFADFGMRSMHSIMTIRGLSNTPYFSDPAVVFYIDDIPYGSTQSNANNLYALDNIEFYRGSQGSLFGKNSYGGVLNIRSKQPENKINSHLSAGYSRFNQSTLNASISGALIPDSLFFALDGAYAASDGYIRNTTLHNNPDHTESIGGQAKLIWKPDAHWEISLLSKADDYKDGMPHITSLNSSDPLKIQSNQNGKLEQNANLQALKIRFQNDKLQFLSVTSRRDWELNPLQPMPI